MPKISDRRRGIPAVEVLLREPRLAETLTRVPRALVLEAVRVELAAARDELRAARSKPPEAAALAARAAVRAEGAFRPSVRRVLNATGVVLHTNLGRAPLARPAVEALAAIAAGYCSLEFDLESGRRGERGTGVERWITRLTGAEAALAANNGAGAILLVLSALATRRRVLVSRGELVEIGGSFRVPEVMEKSGATLLEVGTTNRTHLGDYARALERHDDVGAILRVHRSNFRIEGFTARPDLAELAALAHRHKVPLIEDLGSGALTDLGALGLRPEPTVVESLAAGCDVVTFSGDKLLGGSQAGLVVGRKRWLDRVRRDPLARALRLDKLQLAALEATLALYADPARARREIPALAMLSATAAELEPRARRLADALATRLPGMVAQVREGSGEVGGGALPLQQLPGWVVELSQPGRTAQELERLARAADPPVIGTVRAGRLRLDPRTLSDAEIEPCVAALAAAFAPR